MHLSSTRWTPMRGRQRGVTFLGWVVLLIPMALFVYVAIRLVPVYLNYTKVARTLEQVRTENLAEQTLVPNLVRSTIEKRFDIDYINKPTPQEVLITRSGDGWIIETSYEEIVPLLYNASILLQFEKSVTIP